MLRDLTYEADLKTDLQILLGLAEFELAVWFRVLSRGIHTAVDVGAAYGCYSLFFLCRTSAKKVLAFEPNSDCRRKLVRNLELNALGTDPRMVLSSHKVGSAKEPHVTRLDDQLDDEIGFPCVVKMDIEGAELEALRGAKRLLQAPRVRWILEFHSRDLERQGVQMLRDEGYLTRRVPRSPLRALVPELRPGYNTWFVAFRPTDDLGTTV